MIDYRLIRGGSWFNNPRYCRSVYRYHFQPADADYLVGFRVVCLSHDNDHTIQLEEQADG